MTQKPKWTKGARTGPMRSYMDLRVFACEGLVCVVDERPGAKEGEYCAVLPADMEERITALNQKYRGKTRAQLPASQRQHYDAVVRGSRNLAECIKEARHMGDPSDPIVQAFWQRHRRSNTVKVGLSAGTDAAGYPKLPDLPRGKNTGRTAAPDNGMVPTGNTQFTELHKPARKKNRSGLITFD